MPTTSLYRSAASLQTSLHPLSPLQSPAASPPLSISPPRLVKRVPRRISGHLCLLHRQALFVVRHICPVRNTDTHSRTRARRHSRLRYAPPPIINPPKITVILLPTCARAHKSRAPLHQELRTAHVRACVRVTGRTQQNPFRVDNGICRPEYRPYFITAVMFLLRVNL